MSIDAETRKHFASELDWLERRLAIWQKQEWRIALIGITSSGKSNLVNAFLSESLLPVQVQPTTNSLVICRREAKPRVVIHYLDKSSETIEIQDIIMTRLAQLTDERMNPNNFEGVKEIELFWPQFKFKGNVALIDTPGLDAYKLERHEDLTMHLLLPSVDAVVFLTTAKTNADGRIAHYLDIIGAHGKPVVLVQNKIDSIEPKQGPGSYIERTKAKVAEDHMARLRKLLAKLNSSVRNVPIMQVSAQWALIGKLKESGIPNLVKVIETHVDSLEPHLLEGRYRQLRKELERIVTTESLAGNLPVSKNQTDNETSDLKTLAEKVDKLFTTFKKAIDNVVSHAKEGGNQLISESQQLKRKDIARAKNLCPRVELWLAQGPKDMGNKVQEFQQEVRKIAVDMNLRGEDLQVEAPRGPVTAKMHVPVEQKSESHRVQKDGLWNSIKSCFNADSAYEIRTKTWEELDIPALKRGIEQYTNNERDWMDSASVKVRNHANGICQSLREELERRSQSLTAKINSIMAAENRIKISKDISKLCKEIEREMGNSTEAIFTRPNQKAIVFAENEDRITIPKYIFSLINLADGVSSFRYRLLRDEMLKRMIRHSPLMPNILIWGFDSESLELFLRRFWSDVLTGTPGPGRGFEVIQEPHPVASRIAVALDIPDEKVVDLIAEAKKFMVKKTLVFLLLDAEQPGATEKQLYHSGLLPILNEADGLVLVIQGIRGLENSGQLADGVRGLKSLANRFQLKVDGILANGDVHIASTLVDVLFMMGHEIKTINDEEKWIAKLAAGDLDYEKYVAIPLRKWHDEAITSED